MKDRAKTIGHKIIKESFPLLQGRKICFITTWFRFYALSVWIPPSVGLIIISSRTRNFTDEAFTGLMVHELCHQERYLGMGIKGYLKFITGYIFSKKSQVAEERATDKLTIEKGYGKQLFELTKISHSDKNHRKIIDNYFTPDEIKSYSVKIGKWQ